MIRYVVVSDEPFEGWGTIDNHNGSDEAPLPSFATRDEALAKAAACGLTQWQVEVLAVCWPEE